MIRLLFWSGVLALTINNASAQMGSMGGDTDFEIPDVDGESWIWRTPVKWYPYSNTSELKNDAYIFPAGQKPQKWKEMLHFEEFHSNMGITDAHQAFEQKTQSVKCAGLETEKLKEQTENGYSIYQWVERCTADGTDLVTLRKVTVGEDGLYLVSKAWKYDPKEDLDEWLDYLDETYVCDGSRAHDCSPPNNQRGGGGGGGMSGGMGQ